MTTEEIIKGLENFLDSCDELMAQNPSCIQGWIYTTLVIENAIDKLKTIDN